MIQTYDEIFGVNSYFIVSGESVVVIDPIISADYQRIIQRYRVEFAILTHEHYDHIRSVNELQEQYEVKILCGMDAQKALSDPARNLSKYLDFLGDMIPFGNHKHANKTGKYVCSADGTLMNGQVVMWRGHQFSIISTPGHSRGSICILLDQQYLFSGDTVFKDYLTATRLPGGSTKAFRMITEPWLDSLSPDVVVYPGHTKPFLLGERYR